MLDFEQFSLVEPAFLVTIVAEAVLKDSIVVLLKKLKVKSYTVTEVQGAIRNRRSFDSSPEAEADPSEASPLAGMSEATVEVRAIVSQELSNVILYAIREQNRDFTLFAYRQPVEALIEE